MGHHSDTPFDGDPEAFKAFREMHQIRKDRQDDQRDKMDAVQKRQTLMRDLLNTTGFRGAIGSFPQGQLTPSDEGAIQFAVGEQDGKVVIDFGTSVHWVGMTPQQAADFASVIMKQARLAARRAGESVAFTI
jgi:hypothetical protein